MTDTGNIEVDYMDIIVRLKQPVIEERASVLTADLYNIGTRDEYDKLTPLANNSLNGRPTRPDDYLGSEERIEV